MKKLECDCGQTFNSEIGVMYCQSTNHGKGWYPEGTVHLSRHQAETIIQSLSARATDEMRYHAWEILNTAMNIYEKE